jgi:hypothetical protein
VDGHEGSNVRYVFLVICGEVMQAEVAVMAMG